MPFFKEKREFYTDKGRIAVGDGRKECKKAIKLPEKKPLCLTEATE